jgi:hypothetical protein
MSSIAKHLFATLALSLLATAFFGCGSGNKEGAPLVVTKVGDSKCIQCHSSVTEALTGESIVAQYQRSSPHNTPALGCESCHGGGAMHNGVGPIPFPRPTANRCATCHNGRTATATNANTDFETSNHVTGTPRFTTSYCYRCHTNEGAVLGNIAGWTGNTEILQDPVTQGKVPLVTTFTGFNCETCHEHGGGLRPIKATDAPAGNLVNWDPNNNKLVDQFDLCTSCHTLYNYNGTLLLVNGQDLTAGGGVIPTGRIAARHENEWFRMIASTHFDNPNTGLGANSTPVGTANVIEGYNLRRTGTSPCYDCHGHEAKTQTNPSSTENTIHKDWAQSAHAGHLLTAKYTATTGLVGAAAVAAAMNAGVIDDPTVGGPGWVHYNWDQTTGTGNRAACQACHTSTGISNYLATQNTILTGYNPANNNFSHLSGWTAATGSPQNELLYCWGCHNNAGTGSLRNTSQAILTFTDPSDNPIIITNAGNSTACIVCHGGRGSAGEAILTPSSRFNGHHAPTAGILYSEKTHIGFEYPGQSYANPSFFAHDVIGANAAGPCASCHMGPSATYGKSSHSFSALTESGGVITAINNQALCNSCHTPGGSFEITPAVMEEERNGYAQASTILSNYLANVTGYTNYLNADIIATFATAPEGAYRAYQNAKIGGTLGGTFGGTIIDPVAGEEPCAYVHNRFYIKRLVFDSIDWMLDGAINSTITLSAQTIIDYPEAVVWLGANPATGVATRP